MSHLWECSGILSGMEAIIILARRYSFDSATDGRHVEGVTLTYLTPDSAEPEDSQNVRGYTPFTVTAPIDSFESLQAVPGLYHLDMKQRPDSKGKPVLKCVGVKYVGEFSLFPEVK
jgi:hypothetical protein